MTKTTVLTMHYGGGAQTIYNRMVAAGISGASLELCEELCVRYFKSHPALLTYFNKQVDFAKDKGYVVMPLSGRKIRFYGRPKINKVYNYPIQGAGADILDPALISVCNYLGWGKTRMVGQIHDALLLQVELPRVSEVAQFVHDQMCRPIVLNGQTHSFPVSFHIGWSWASQVEFKRLDDLLQEAPTWL